MVDNSTPAPNALKAVYSVLKVIYGVLFWIVLALQLFFCVRLWRYTVTYDYFCGNPLMGQWSGWAIISSVTGLILLPGAVWALWHRRKRAGVVYGVAFLLYLVSVVIILGFGALQGIVPDCFSFPPW